jgi:hypothetical protein
MKKTTGVKTRPVHDPYIESRYGYIEELGTRGETSRRLDEGAKFTGPTGVPTRGARSKSFEAQINSASRGTARGK